MSDNKTITFALMDAPYENARSTTALRLIDIAARRGYTVNVFAYGKLDWINCGLCVDERGVHEALEFARRGTPGDLWKWAESSDNTLVIPTK